MPPRIVRLLETSYLEALRLDRGLEADEVARRAQIDAVNLRILEVKGAKYPRPATLRKLADVYDVRPAKLADELRSYRERYEREAERREREVAA